MTSLTAIFGRSDEKPQENSEKLLQLYWNRAELKKEYAERGVISEAEGGDKGKGGSLLGRFRGKS